MCCTYSKILQIGELPADVAEKVKVAFTKRQAPTAADIKAAIAESGVDVEAVNI